LLSGVKELVVGVIGGLGPEATLDFYAKVLKHSHASKDQDHIHLIIESNPKTPNRNEAIAGRGPSPAPELADMARALERAGADFVVMACNTAHAYEADIRTALKKPFVSLIDEVVDEVRTSNPTTKRVGVLATQGSRDANIFAPAFSRHDIDVLQLSDASQHHFMDILYLIKSGDRSSKIHEAMQQLGEELVVLGADILIAGCTEVPLVLRDGDNTKSLIDSTDVLARRCVAYARGLKQLPVPPETS
jgi:aspartate racemase